MPDDGLTIFMCHPAGGREPWVVREPHERRTATAQVGAGADLSNSNG
ncbi:MAG: hypothetical protein GX131_00960 [candidate division WS1 bacterium]|jgi:hypothetical protein|nr:hypothetical protein [candidate division WS1 bacterium]